MRQLNGLRLLNTRPQELGAQLTDTIEARGGCVIALPLLQMIATTEQWWQQIPSLQTIRCIIFVSQSAVRFFFEGLRARNQSLPAKVPCIAIGQATANVLAQSVAQPVLQPTVATTEGLLAMEALHDVKGQGILVVKGVGGRKTLIDELQARQAIVTNIDVYQRLLPTYSASFVSKIWQDDLVDVVLITSVQALVHLFELFGKEAYSWVCDKTFVVLSERIARAAKSKGIRNTEVCTYESIIDALERIQVRNKHDRKQSQDK